MHLLSADTNFGAGINEMTEHGHHLSCRSTTSFKTLCENFFSLWKSRQCPNPENQMPTRSLPSGAVVGKLSSACFKVNSLC